MIWEIRFSDIAVESLDKMDKQVGRRIKDRLYNRLVKQKDPRRYSQVKRIAGVKNLFRYRIGDYRVLFKVFDREVLIIVADAGHRSEIYRELKKGLTQIT